MDFFKNKSEKYIIAEVGQNHQGSLELAIEYIEQFSRLGASAIKFQTRDNKHLFSKEAYDAVYHSENAFGKSYGEHREALELSRDDLLILKKKCAENKVDFISTPFDEPSLKLLAEINVDLLKIASFDIGNLPFINRICQLGKPVVLSVGGANWEQITSSVQLIEEYSLPLAILHCVSEYPCPFDKLGLEQISDLTSSFPQHVIGSSDHFNGILSGPIAALMGAVVFEKHVTLNRSWKGTDHSFALGKEAFRRFVRDINRVEKMLKAKPDKDLGKETVFKRLGKSLTFNKDLNSGHTLQLDDLSGKIFVDTFIPVRESQNYIGRILTKTVTKGQIVADGDFEKYEK